MQAIKQAIKQANNQESKQSNNQERSRTMNDNHNENEEPFDGTSEDSTLERGLRTFSWRPNGKIFVCPVLRNESVRWGCISPRR